MSAVGADDLSVYDYIYMVEVLISDEPSSVGLAGAGIFLFASLTGKLLLCFGSNFALFFLCADGGMSLVAKPHSEPLKVVVVAKEHPWVKFCSVIETGEDPRCAASSAVPGATGATLQRAMDDALVVAGVAKATGEQLRYVRFSLLCHRLA